MPDERSGGRRDDIGSGYEHVRRPAHSLAVKPNLTCVCDQTCYVGDGCGGGRLLRAGRWPAPESLPAEGRGGSRSRAARLRQSRATRSALDRERGPDTMHAAASGVDGRTHPPHYPAIRLSSRRPDSAPHASRRAACVSGPSDSRGPGTRPVGGVSGPFRAALIHEENNSATDCQAALSNRVNRMALCRMADATLGKVTFIIVVELLRTPAR